MCFLFISNHTDNKKEKRFSFREFHELEDEEFKRKFAIEK